MATSGPLGAGTGANDATVGTLAWTNPGNITADDATNAAATAVMEATTNYLKATNFGHAIPSGTINGVAYGFERSATGTVTDSAVRFVNAGTIGTVNKSGGAAWASETKTFGGASDVWDGSLTPAVLNDATTSVVLSCVCAIAATANVDYVTSTVTYTVGGLMFYQKRSLQGGMLFPTDGVN